MYYTSRASHVYTTVYLYQVLVHQIDHGVSEVYHNDQASIALFQIGKEYFHILPRMKMYNTFCLA